MSIKQLLEVQNCDLQLSTDREIADAVKIIAFVENMTPGECKALKQLFEHGPIHDHDGDVPSKTARDNLITAGLACKIVVNGDDGFNACTNKGLRAYRALNAH